MERRANIFNCRCIHQQILTKTHYIHWERYHRKVFKKIEETVFFLQESAFSFFKKCFVLSHKNSLFNRFLDLSRVELWNQDLIHIKFQKPRKSTVRAHNVLFTTSRPAVFG